MKNKNSLLLSVSYLAVKNNFKLFHTTLMIIALFALGFAYYVQYILNLAPCPLCIYQRIPYFLLIKASILTLVFNKICRYAAYWSCFVILTATILAGYHTGVERQIFEPSRFCTSALHIPENMSIQEIRNMFDQTPVVSCTKPALVIFGLSMTEWNLVFNFGLLVCCTIILYNTKDC